MTKGRTKAQRAQIAGLNASRAVLHPQSPNIPSPRSRTHPKTRRAQEDLLKKTISEKESRIRELEAGLLAAHTRADAIFVELHEKAAEFTHLQSTATENENHLSQTISELQKIQDLLAETQEHLQKARKRTRRLEREKETLRSTYQRRLRETTATHKKVVEDLSCFVSEAEAKERLSDDLEKARHDLLAEKETNAMLRKKVHSLDMQGRRAKRSLQDVRRRLDKLSIWKCTSKGTYTSGARRLARALLRAGCAGDRVGEAIVACAKAFRVSVLRVPSRRTVFRARDEGGHFGLMQLGREIAQSKGFGESSDGTTDRKVTYESHHVTLACPTYSPGVDDSDKSTWTNQTRFVMVEPALDHKSKTQFEGTKELAEKIATIYSDSPLASRDDIKMEANDWIRKEEYQNMDHAADGKKKLFLCQQWKKEVVVEDLGRKAMDALESGQFLDSLTSLTQAEIETANQQAAQASNDGEVDRATATKLIAKILGQAVLDALPNEQRELLLAITFSGCCGHKDLNAFKYGVLKMSQGWEARKHTPPVLLANKANATTIRLGDADSAAVQQAVDSSSRGGVKAASLAGALFNHSDDKRGYQDIHRSFMTVQKKELHGLVDDARFPDTSNTRYQSHTYAGAELITFLDLYVELLEQVRDSKVKPGFNHVEANLYKALQDLPTITELAAMTLYGISLSWPYLSMVRGNGTSVQNILSAELIALHHRLPSFCEYIAANPSLFLLHDETVDFSKTTLDGKPWSHPMAVMAIQVMALELPDLEAAISDIFLGAADGWRQFTQEFTPGGPFDSLTVEQRSRLFIPATNDANEGALGSWRVWRRYHPSSTATSFSNKTRSERNNTEGFIEKLCNEEDQCYVMRAVRVQGASGENARFRKHLVDTQRKRMVATRQKQDAAEQKKRQEIERLTNVGLVVDRNIIEKMTARQLDDQLNIHIKILNDEVLRKVLKKDLKLKAAKLSALLDALTRNEDKILSLYQALHLLMNGQNAQVDSSHGSQSILEAENAEDQEDENEDIEEDEYF